MSQETVPGQGGEAYSPATAPTGLLQQMEELMAALNADLAGLDADLQSSARGAGPAPAAWDDRA
jgi:hypothetical protein